MRIRTDSVLHHLLRELHERTREPVADRLRDAAVHDAVAQVMTYLREFDEQRDRIHERYGIDVRRAAGI